MDASSIIAEFTHRADLPRDALLSASANRAKMAPFFISQIESYLAKEPEHLAPHALLFVFHLLGEWREQNAYPALARLIRSPSGEIDAVLGSGVTTTSHRVMAAVYNGDPQPLFDIILDAEADEFIRARMCEALAMLVREGRLNSEIVAGFLKKCFTELQPQDTCFVWSGWQSAIAMLGLKELSRLVEQAFRLDFISSSWLTFEDFQEDLEQAVEHRGSEDFGPEGEYTLFGDTVEELAAWDVFSEEYLQERAKWMRERKEEVRQKAENNQTVNPFRRVGRNDPCPCGSGKKSKKCCFQLGVEPRTHL
jgi:hypothetical protein